MIKKYRICRRYSPNAGTWYLVQKKRWLFGWHTLNISFGELDMANQYINCVLSTKRKDDICETPLIWKEKKQEFCEVYPCETDLIKVK